MEPSYYEGEMSSALHTDLCSPLDTDPTWSRLEELRERLMVNGLALWHQLVEYLAPDVIVVSIARNCRDQIAFAENLRCQPLVTIPSAGLSDLFGDGQMIAPGPGERGADALLQLACRQQPGRFDDAAFAVDPPRFDGIEPGAFGRQEARHQAHAAVAMHALVVRA